MKALISTAIAGLIWMGSVAQAAQYQVYLAHPANPVTVENEFSDLLQQRIYIDTDRGIVQVPAPARCGDGQLCTEALRFHTYFISEARIQRGQLMALAASSKNAEIRITQGENHSTLVVIRGGGEHGEMSYVGSPAEAL